MLIISDIWSLCLPLTEAIKLRLLRKRELVAVDGCCRCYVSVVVLCLFLTLPWLSIVRGCCISWLNSHTFSYIKRQSFMRCMFLHRTHLFEEKIQSNQGLKIKKMRVPSCLTGAYFFVPNPKFLSTFRGFFSSAILFPHFPHLKTFTNIEVFPYLRSY